jgi:MFS family permease
MTAYRLLRSNRVARIWFLANLQSWVGNGAAWPALALLAADRWHSGWAISLVLAGDFVPRALLGTFTGRLADRYSRRRLMLISPAVSFLAFVLIFVSSNYPVLLIGACLAGIAGAIGSPASKAVVAQIGQVEDISVLAALRSGCQAFGFTLGPAIAAGLLTVISPRWLLLFDAGTFALEWGMVRRLPAFMPTTDDDPDERPGSTLAIVRGYQIAATIIVVTAFGELFGPILNVALVPFARQLLHHGNASVGLLAAVTGIGLCAASLILTRSWSLATLRWVFIFSWLAYGLSLPIMALAPVIGVALLAKMVQGASNAATLSSEVSLINATVPQQYTGRIFGLNDAVASGAFAISFIFAGALLSATSVSVTLAIAGGGCLIAGLIAMIGMRGAHLSYAATKSSITRDEVQSRAEVEPHL